MRDSLDDVERSLKNDAACGGTFGTMTEQLHQLIGQWDMLVRFSNTKGIAQLPNAFGPDEEPK
jgi:hypothetical protein